MATLLPTPPGDRDKGIEDVRAAALRFIGKRGLRITFPLTKPDSRLAIGELWDGLGDLDYRSLLSGTLKTSLPDEFVALLVYAIIRQQFAQYLSTLPPLKQADISGSQGDA